MATAAAPRPDRSHDLPPARPAIAPDGPVPVGALLRREGRAAHSVDRPVLPRARDLANEGGTGHRAAVAAGAVLAVTAVLGTNVVGGATFGQVAGSGEDRAPSAPAGAPGGALSLAATTGPLSHAMAALKAAVGAPAMAALVDDGGATASGARIVAQALGAAAPAVGTPATALSAAFRSAVRTTVEDQDATDRDTDRDTGGGASGRRTSGTNGSSGTDARRRQGSADGTTDVRVRPRVSTATTQPGGTSPGADPVARLAAVGPGDGGTPAPGDGGSRSEEGSSGAPTGGGGTSGSGVTTAATTGGGTSTDPVAATDDSATDDSATDRATDSATTDSRSTDGSSTDSSASEKKTADAAPETARAAEATSTDATPTDGEKADDRTGASSEQDTASGDETADAGARTDAAAAATTT